MIRVPSQWGKGNASLHGSHGGNKMRSRREKRTFCLVWFEVSVVIVNDRPSKALLDWRGFWLIKRFRRFAWGGNNHFQLGGCNPGGVNSSSIILPHGTMHASKMPGLVNDNW